MGMTGSEDGAKVTEISRQKCGANMPEGKSLIA
jgi:hypothetical protein